MRHGTSMRLPSPSPGEQAISSAPRLGTSTPAGLARLGTSAHRRARLLRLAFGGVVVLGALSALGCGGATPSAANEKKGPQVASDPRGPALQVVGGGYEVVPAKDGKTLCAVQTEALPAACGGSSACAVTSVERAHCNAPVFDIGISGQTAAFLLGPERPDRHKSAFGVWGAGDKVRVVEAPGTAPRVARRADGHIHLVRIENRTVVDYQIDQGDLLRRAWDVFRGEHDELTSAAWANNKLYSRVTSDLSASWSYEEFAMSEDHRSTKIELRLPASHWGTPWNQAREADGRWLSVGYGSNGIGLFTGAWGWSVPPSVARSGTSLRALAGAGKAPLIGFVSFDMSDLSGVHVIVPNKPFPTDVKEAKTGVKALDLHIVGSRAARKNDCPTQEEPKPRKCTRSESHTEGMAMARSPGDDHVWIAFYTATFEHTGVAQMECPQVHCKNGQPCHQPQCSLRETSPKDDARVELHVYRLSDSRGSLEHALTMPVRDTAIGGGAATLEMDAEGSALYLVHRSGNDDLVRFRIDTSRLPLSPATSTDVDAVPITLVPMGTE